MVLEAGAHEKKEEVRAVAKGGGPRTIPSRNDRKARLRCDHEEWRSTQAPEVRPRDDALELET